jgi:Immunoglobulin domain
LNFIFFLQVLPIIAPFNFGEEELNLDDSVTATCSITKGDLPIHIWWQFSDGMESQSSYNLTTNDGIVVTRTTQKLSFLNIDAVKARHRGNYTCFASNKGGFAQHSSYLAMNG